MKTDAILRTTYNNITLLFLSKGVPINQTFDSLLSVVANEFKDIQQITDENKRQLYHF